MSQIRIVTDSVSDLPPELAAEHGITVVPLQVIFGPDSFRDGIDLGGDSFYEKLTTSEHHPRTSQPSPADFAGLYEELTADGATVISIHVSEKMSGTLGSARLARQMLQDRDIHVVDSQSASLGQGLQAVAAAEAVRAGRSVQDILQLLEQAAAATRVYFAVDTLEYLQRNGRIGRAQAMLGSLLSIKPLLQLEAGSVAPLDKVRGKARVMPRLLELVREAVPAGSRARFGLMHAQVPERAAELQAQLVADYPDAEFVTASIGAVVGTHAGPGTFGIVALPEAAGA